MSRSASSSSSIRSVGCRHCSSSVVAKKALQGFTLVELMVTMALAALLMGLAAPYFQESSLNSKLSSEASRLVASAQLARGEAIKRNATVALCVSSNGLTCTTTGDWEQGWILLTGETVLHREQASPAGFRIIEKNAATRLSFASTGLGSSGTTFRICRAAAPAGSPQRVVSVSLTGQTGVKKAVNEDC